VPVVIGRRRRLGEHAQRVRGQVDGHGGPLHETRRGAVVRRNRLHEKAAEHAQVELAEAPEKDDVLDEGREAVRAIAPVRFHEYPLRTDERLDLPARISRSDTGGEPPPCDFELAGVPSRARGLRRDEIRGAEEVGDEDCLGLLLGLDGHRVTPTSPNFLRS
jgi:hypothetical protein